MKVTPLRIPDVLLVEPTGYRDDRGFFFESFNQARFDQAVGQHIDFVQDNHSLSAQHVLRGLHYQVRCPQGKLVRVVVGAVFDVAVDLRRDSASFGCWVAETLTADNKKQLWIPPGFAHGFLTLSPSAEFLYKTTDYYSPADERCIAWNDPALGIDWPLRGDAIVSDKDALGVSFDKAELA